MYASNRCSSPFRRLLMSGVGINSKTLWYVSVFTGNIVVLWFILDAIFLYLLFSPSLSLSLLSFRLPSSHLLSFLTAFCSSAFPPPCPHSHHVVFHMSEQQHTHTHGHGVMQTQLHRLPFAHTHSTHSSGRGVTALICHALSLPFIAGTIIQQTSDVISLQLEIHQAQGVFNCLVGAALPKPPPFFLPTICFASLGGVLSPGSKMSSCFDGAYDGVYPSSICTNRFKTELID